MSKLSNLLVLSGLIVGVPLLTGSAAPAAPIPHGAPAPAAPAGEAPAPGTEKSAAAPEAAAPAEPAKARPVEAPARMAHEGEQAAPSAPPSLMGSALLEEVQKGRRDRDQSAGKLEAERARLAAERTRLEALASDVARARDALKQETARLEALVKAAPAACPTATPAQSAETAAPARPTLIKAQLDTLAKSMKAMKPEQAAGLVSRLDRSLVVPLLQRMRPGDAGAVLAQLKPELAADLMVAMATTPGSGGKP